MLDTLPVEILSCIAGWLPRRALRFLSQASCRLHSIFIPLLYHRVKFRAASEWALNVIDIGTFFRLHKLSGDSCYLQYTRELSISAPINLARFNRCTYFNIFRVAGQLIGVNKLGTSNEAKAHERFLDDISHQLHFVQSRLKINHLRSLEWRLGTCLPPGLLDPNGYIDRHQKCLKHISLVTDGTCPHSGHCLGALRSLSSLKYLEWEGVGRPAEFETLRTCMLRNRKHLAALSIGFIASVTTLDIYQDLFGKPLDEPKLCDDTDVLSIQFPCLISLTLSKAALPPKLRPEDALIFGSLQSLILRNCTNQITFLDSICRSHRSMQLAHLEFCYDSVHEHEEDRDVSPLLHVLLSLESLKHLHLKLSNLSDTSQIQLAIRKHRPTLKSFAYHERDLLPIDGEGLFEDIRDKTPVWLSDLLWTTNLYEATALALCMAPSTVRSRLEPIARTSKLQILHFRFSGSERAHRNFRGEILTQLRGNKKSWLNDLNPDRNSQYLLGDTSGSDLSSDSEDQAFGSFEEEPYEPRLPNKPPATISEAKEFVNFADWAFSPKGLPALQILAFGDFSFEDQYHEQQFLVHRRSRKPNHAWKTCQDRSCEKTHDRNFVAVDLSEPSLWDSIEVNGPNFLSICPESGLLESPYV